MSSMGHYKAHSDEPLTPEELAQAKRLLSDPMALQNTALLQWIKDYIAVQPCCSNSGGGSGQGAHGRALLVRASALSWYGLGDGSSTGGSLVHNYGTGADGNLGLSPHTDTWTPNHAGTDGADSGYNLKRDSGSYIGPQKTDPNPGGYEGTPGVQVYDHVDTTNGLSVVCWIKYLGAGIHYESAGLGLDTWGNSPIWGWRGAGNVGLYLYARGETVLHGAGQPASVGDLRLGMGDGTPAHSFEINAGQGASNGGWHQVGFTVDNATKIATVYIDGADIVSGDVSAVDPQASVQQGIGIVNFGGFLGSNYGNWYGNIDELGVWGRALTGAEIHDLYIG